MNPLCAGERREDLFYRAHYNSTASDYIVFVENYALTWGNCSLSLFECNSPRLPLVLSSIIFIGKISRDFCFYGAARETNFYLTFKFCVSVGFNISRLYEIICN